MSKEFKKVEDNPRGRSTVNTTARATYKKDESSAGITVRVIRRGKNNTRVTRKLSSGEFVKDNSFLVANETLELQTEEAAS